MPVKLNSAGGGSVTLTTPSTASDFTVTMPAATGTAALTASPTFTGTTTTGAQSVGGNITFSAADAGIIFNKTGALTNTKLNDYEEGTWTPVLTFGGNAGVTTYAQQNGNYTRVGNAVTVRAYISITTKSANTGVARLTGLPYSTKNSGSFQTFYFYVSGQSITGTPMAYIASGGTAVELGQTNGSTGFVSLSNTNFSNGGDMIIQTTYIAE
jgi:hypothetical protein